MPYIDQLFSQETYAPAHDIASLLQEYTTIGIVAHASPDADALGSTLALAHGLLSLGKKVLLCNASPIPEYLAWLPFTGPLYTQFPSHAQAPQVMVVLDCGDSARLAEVEEMVLGFPTINIDHHLDNPLFGTVYNWADPTMAATGQMVAALLHALHIPLKDEIATCIYTAVSSDTGNFSFGNTNEGTFLLMAHLMQHGLDMVYVREILDKTWHLKRMHLWGELMQNLQLERDGTVALVSISQKQLQKHGAHKDDLEGFAEHLRRTKGVFMAGIVREDGEKRCKVSLRSSGTIDVRAVVRLLGGGGHRNAAGATLKNTLSTSHEKILSGMIKWLDDNAL